MQKNASDYFPDWIRRARLAKEDGEVDHVVAEDAATLVYLANQACITLHAGLFRIDRIDHPDMMVLDLDPSDDDFAKVKRAAKDARALLEEVGLTSFVQTTGSRGLHVWVPLDRSRDLRRGARGRLQPGRGARRAPARRAHHRAAQGQTRRSRLPRRGAQRLRPDGGSALFGARAARGIGRHAARLGGARQPRPRAAPLYGRETCSGGSRRSPTPGRASASSAQAWRRRARSLPPWPVEERAQGDCSITPQARRMPASPAGSVT